MKQYSLLLMIILAVGLFGCEKIKQSLDKVQKKDTTSSEKTAVKTDPAGKETAKPEPKEAEKPKVSEPSSQKEVLARLNGKPISDEEVTKRVKNRLSKLQAQIFDIKRSGLENVIEEKLIEQEATKRKISTDELIKVEINSKVEEPTETEVTTYYNLFKKRFGNKPLEEVKKRLVAQLKSSKRQAAYSKFVNQLKKDANIEIMMERPRAEVSVDDDPSQGNPDAKVVLIEFSDFQCPFCKRARPTVNKILEAYKGKVHYVYRDFPLSFHKQAKKAAEAAHCAGDQDKYWDYNTKLWENQRELQPAKLKAYAKDLGLDSKKFDDCLDSGKYADEIDKDMRDGSRAGVSGTPAYFINGMIISGAQPFEKFKALIDEELARLEK